MSDYMAQQMDRQIEGAQEDYLRMCDEFVRLQSLQAQMLAALRQVTILRQLGGMLPGVRETIVIVLESVDAAIAAAESLGATPHGH